MKNIKLRYYLRALGIGIVVTALILGIAGGKNGAVMTDDQVRERALELGMVDGNSLVLSDLRESEESVEPSVEEVVEETPEEISEEASEEIAEDTSEEVTEEIQEEVTEETSEETIEETSEEVQEEPTEESQEESVEESVEESAEPQDYVTLTIKSGASSYGVSKNLVELGVIESARDFDNYLCNNGYSKAIRVGTFEIPTDADEEKIAKIITGKR